MYNALSISLFHCKSKNNGTARMEYLYDTIGSTSSKQQITLLMNIMKNNVLAD